MPDWTKELFENHPESFLGALEERLAQASAEVDTLLGCLEEHGFKPQRILDLNCGIGRHSVELGKRGIEVVGTDLSPLYVEIAEKRAREEKVDGKVHFRVADMREIASVLKGERSFDGIANLWTSFGFYDDETNNQILRQCRDFVLPGGFFALDIINRDWVAQNFEERGFSVIKDRIILEERHLNLDESRIYTTWTFLREREKKRYFLERKITLDHRVWSLHELVLMFKETGWQFKAAYPGLAQQREDVSLMDAKQLLFIGQKQ